LHVVNTRTLRKDSILVELILKAQTLKFTVNNQLKETSFSDSTETFKTLEKVDEEKSQRTVEL